MNNNYAIYTICTGNFKDAYDFAIDSWLKNTTAKKIYVYSDMEWEVSDERVEIVPVLHGGDWLQSVNYKVAVSKDVLDRPFSNFVFLDMDCYLTGDLAHVFDNEFDFAITRLIGHNPDVRVSTGIFFFHNTEKTLEFFDEWEELQPTVWGKEKACSQSQNSFSILIRKHHKAGDYAVMDIDVDVYNRKTSRKWIPNLEKDIDKTIVLHFYNNAYRDRECVDSVMRML